MATVILPKSWFSALRLQCRQAVAQAQVAGAQGPVPEASRGLAQEPAVAA